jgi:hypothetical protein
MRVSFRRDRGDEASQHVSPFIEIEETRGHSTRLLSSRQWKHAYTRHVSFSQDRGDALWKYFLCVSDVEFV